MSYDYADLTGVNPATDEALKEDEQFVPEFDYASQEFEIVHSEIDEAQSKGRELEGVYNNILDRGLVSRQDRVTLESILPEEINLPPANSYTELPSKVNYNVTMEGVLGSIKDGVVKFIKAIRDFIVKCYKWIANLIKNVFNPSNGQNPATDAGKKQMTKTNDNSKKIIKRAKAVNEKNNIPTSSGRRNSGKADIGNDGNSNNKRNTNNNNPNPKPNTNDVEVDDNGDDVNGSIKAHVNPRQNEFKPKFKVDIDENGNAVFGASDSDKNNQDKQRTKKENYWHKVHTGVNKITFPRYGTLQSLTGGGELDAEAIIEEMYIYSLTLNHTQFREMVLAQSSELLNLITATMELIANYAPQLKDRSLILAFADPKDPVEDKDRERIVMSFPVEIVNAANAYPSRNKDYDRNTDSYMCVQQAMDYVKYLNTQKAGGTISFDENTVADTNIAISNMCSGIDVDRIKAINFNQDIKHSNSLASSSDNDVHPEYKQAYSALASDARIIMNACQLLGYVVNRLSDFKSHIENVQRDQDKVLSCFEKG